ncbi:MAG: CDP-archaeol synthase [Gemmatimonadota bacterium]|nr:MAG: CDP-archaeol synthase [Gemmatimonadota bacterium]
MISRIFVAAVAVPTAVAIVYVGGWALSVGLAVLAGVGAAELYRLAGRSGVHPMKELGCLGAALVPLLVFAAGMDGLGLGYRYLVFSGPLLLMLVMAFAVVRRTPADRPLAGVAVTAFGILYAGGLLAFLVLLRHPREPMSAWGATWLVFLPLTVIWVCDSVAMALGSAIGGPKFAPVVSPNKTWAGTISGTLAGGIVAPLYGFLLLDRVAVELDLAQLVVFGLVVSSVGQIGDLAESLFKREVGVKDSGGFFPGHGGVLDRLDSLYWAIPTATLLLRVYGVA